MKAQFLATIMSLTIGGILQAQITPAGFDHTQIVSWEAAGIIQSLDSLGKKQILVYLGAATESRPDDANLFERPGIFVSDQQFQHQFHPHFKYNSGLSYRLQHHYSGQYPFDHDSPGKVHEIRTYSTFSWTKSFRRAQWDLSFKEEIRNFFTTEIVKPKSTLKLRSRIKSRWKFSLDKNKIHQLIFQAEALLSTGKGSGQTWDQFHYTDTRLSAFYSFSPKNYSFRLEVGYMNEIRGIDANEDISFLAVNILWINPFKYHSK